MKHFSKLFKLSFLMSLTAFLLLAASPAYAANVFETITGRAVGVLTGVKQLVFVLAGFGIIAFAFMAIFGKLSWKHFANIAIGLFLVASMGLFIQYFVTKDGTSYKLSYGNYLGSAFGDTAGTAGDSFGGADGSLNPDGSFGGGGAGGGAGTETSGGQLGFDPVTGLPLVGGEGLSGGGIDENLDITDANVGSGSGGNAESGKNKDEKRGFKGFISDVKNIANAAQQAKSAVDAGINFAKNAAATYENVKNSVENNGTGIKGLLNSASDIAGGVKDLKQGAESTVSTIGAKTSGVANSIQDVGKTEQQLAENRQVRNDGGSTNKISEWLNREGKGGSTANEIKDRVDKTANPVLDNVGEAAYDAKGVVTMAGSGGVSGMVGAAAGAAAGVGAILNATGAVGGSRSDNGNTGGGNEQPTVQTQEQSTTPTLDRLMQGDELLSTPALREHASAIQEVDALEQEKRRLQNAGASVEEINAVNDKLKEAEKRRDEAEDAAYNDYKKISENKNDQLADELKKRSEEQDLQFKIEAEQRRNAYSNGNSSGGGNL